MSSVEHPIFRGLMRKPIYRGDCLKSRPWTVWRFKRELGIKEGVLFLREVDTQLSESTAALYIAAVSAVVKVSRAAFFTEGNFVLFQNFFSLPKILARNIFYQVTNIDVLLFNRGNWMQELLFSLSFFLEISSPPARMFTFYNKDID